MFCKIVTSEIFDNVNHEKLLVSAVLEKIHVRNTFCGFTEKGTPSQIVFKHFI